MKILKAIGAFFARIWRWIKETAWVQPLLIVGAIFAIIFAIPSFSKWLGSLGVGQENYYAAYKLSLEGELMYDIDKEKALTASHADKITESIAKNSNFEDKENFSYADYTEDVGEYGMKYFLVFVKEDCSVCTEIQEAFKTLHDNWGKNTSLNSFVPAETTVNGVKQDLPFRIHTIFTDEESSTDDNYADETNAFKRYLDNHLDFFEEAGSRLTELTPYKANKNVSKTNYEYFTKADKTNFAVPTIMLVDYTDEAMQLTRYGSNIKGRQGISEVLFGVDGSSRFEKASVLMDMWNHQNGSSDNPFSSNYRKA